MDNFYICVIFFFNSYYFFYIFLYIYIFFYYIFIRWLKKKTALSHNSVSLATITRTPATTNLLRNFICKAGSSTRPSKCTTRPVNGKGPTGLHPHTCPRVTSPWCTCLKRKNSRARASWRKRKNSTCPSGNLISQLPCIKNTGTMTRCVTFFSIVLRSYF